MEKLVYALWNRPDESEAEFNRHLLGPLGARLTELGAHRLQMNLADETVAPGAPLRQRNLRPQPAAIVSFWLNSAHIRAAFETALESASSRIAGYVVSESTVLPNTEPAGGGARTPGFAQIALIAKPPRLTRAAFLDIWLGTHTRVGVETQSSFYYCQNIVTRALTHGAPPWAAIVEECFPIGAMTDPHLFFDAVGEPGKFDRNLARMMESCHRFIDFDKIDVLVTSEFRLGAWSDLTGQPEYPK